MYTVRVHIQHCVCVCVCVCMCVCVEAQGRRIWNHKVPSSSPGQEQQQQKKKPLRCVLGQGTLLPLSQSTQLYKWVPGASWGAKAGNPVGGVQHRWLQVGLPSPASACRDLMPTPGGAPVGCSSQSSGPAWVEVWLPDAQACVAKWRSLTWRTCAGGRDQFSGRP